MPIRLEEVVQMMLKPGDVAVEFECPWLTRTRGGNPEDEGPDLAVGLWRLADGLAQGPVLLMFVKAGCPTCEYSLPLIDRIYRNYPESRVSMVALAQERESGARRLIRDGNLHLKVGLDSSPHSIGESYGVSYVPTFFYIRPDGIIENVIESFAREELKEINAKIAQEDGVAVRPFFSLDEGVPGFRPG